MRRFLPRLSYVPVVGRFTTQLFCQIDLSESGRVGGIESTTSLLLYLPTYLVRPQSLQSDSYLTIGDIKFLNYNSYFRIYCFRAWNRPASHSQSSWLVTFCNDIQCTYQEEGKYILPSSLRSGATTSRRGRAAPPDDCKKFTASQNLN